MKYMDDGKPHSSFTVVQNCLECWIENHIQRPTIRRRLVATRQIDFFFEKKKNYIFLNGKFVIWTRFSLCEFVDVVRFNIKQRDTKIYSQYLNKKRKDTEHRKMIREK